MHSIYAKSPYLNDHIWIYVCIYTCVCLFPCINGLYIVYIHTYMHSLHIALRCLDMNIIQCKNIKFKKEDTIRSWRNFFSTSGFLGSGLDTTVFPSSSLVRVDVCLEIISWGPVGSSKGCLDILYHSTLMCPIFFSIYSFFFSWGLFFSSLVNFFPEVLMGYLSWGFIFIFWGWGGDVTGGTILVNFLVQLRYLGSIRQSDIADTTPESGSAQKGIHDHLLIQKLL